jgi:hypothetical protein
MRRPLPVPGAGGLVSVGDTARPGNVLNGTPPLDVFSYPLYLRLRNRNTVFTGLLASGDAGKLEVGDGSGASEPVRGRLVSGNYFDVLGIPAALGRTFTPGDESSPGPRPSRSSAMPSGTTILPAAATPLAAPSASTVMLLQLWASVRAVSPAR